MPVVIALKDPSGHLPQKPPQGRACEELKTRGAFTPVENRKPPPKPPSACRIAAIHQERVTDHKAGTRARQPEDGCGNLLRLAKAPDWFALHHFGQGLGITAGHRLHHWRLDRAWANRVD